MTNEEAIRLLDINREHLKNINIIGFEDDIEALDMAIKALEQESCEDCISRAQALSDYADWFGYGYADNTFYKHLKIMPSIQPKPKTDVLDKIREEIELHKRKTESIDPYDLVGDCLEIIDKCKTEKE